MFKKCVLRWRLKVAVQDIAWRDSGREFQMVGPETQNIAYSEREHSA